jgi:hypothetical protein
LSCAIAGRQKDTADIAKMLINCLKHFGKRSQIFIPSVPVTNFAALQIKPAEAAGNTQECENAGGIGDRLPETYISYYG